MDRAIILGYDKDMKTAKVSFTLPQDLLDEMRALVGEGNLSAYIAQGVERQVRADHLARFLVELDHEYGPVPADEIEAVRREWRDEA